MKANHEERHQKLSESLKKAKKFFSEEELARRLKWIRFLSEEKLKDEEKKTEKIFSFFNSLLISTSFLFAAFATFVTTLLFNEKHAGTLCIIFSFLCGFSIIVSIVLQLSIIWYRKRYRPDFVYSLATTYLDPEVAFNHAYSEDYGRILSLDSYVISIKKSNDVLKKLEIISLIFLLVFIVTFIVSFIALFCGI